MTEDDLEKKAEEWVKENTCKDCSRYVKCKSNEYCTCKECSKEKWKNGAEFGYNKTNEWYKVSEILPEMDVLVYLWNKSDDFPVVACRHIPYGQKDWVWDYKWGSGFTVSQLVGEDYLWKEIVLPKESNRNTRNREVKRMKGYVIKDKNRYYCGSVRGYRFSGFYGAKIYKSYKWALKALQYIKSHGNKFKFSIYEVEVIVNCEVSEVEE